jgi:type IV fimbrial biogenesis protein FimT
MRKRSGISLVETVIALSVAGVLLSVGIPRFTTIRARGAVRSAQSRFVSALASARAAAIQRHGTASVIISGNRVTVTTNGGATTLMGAIPFDTLYSTTLSVSPNTVTRVDYDARGMAFLATGVATFVFNRAGVRPDSVCVNRLGIVRRSCAVL